MKNINMTAFHQQFAKEYEFLYAARDRVAGYDEAVNAFDAFLSSNDGAAFVGECAKYRGDMVTSDREAAAFMFALDALGALDDAPSSSTEGEGLTGSSAAPVFTAHDMTLPNGEKHDVTWHLYGGDAIAEIDLGGGKHANVTIDEKSPWYIPAMCAAQEAERIAEAEAAEEKRMEQERRRAERANDPAKQAHGPVPEKEWIGTKITGLGWRVEFSRTYDRTMIIFDSVPTDAARAIVKECGFYWSPSLGAWVKGLNWRAYRAANQAAEKLTALKESPCKVRKRRAA